MTGSLISQYVNYKMAVMKRIVYCLIAAVVTLGCCCSCLPISFNDNEELYGSEWSSDAEDEGLKFFNDDSVLFFSTSCRAGSKFEYYKSTGKVSFDNFIVSFPSFTAEITEALIENNDLYMSWHKLGESESFYATYHKRR